MNMNIQEGAVPYAERHLITDSGFALIWPFINVPKGNGPYELFLDTNALSDTRWANEIPKPIRERAILNPFFALMEEWLSNEQFRANPFERIEAFIGPLEAMGLQFRKNFAGEQADLLALNHSQLCNQCSLLFPNIAIVKSLLREKISSDAALSRVRELVMSDIPKFSGCLMFMALAVLLKSRQSMKLQGDDIPAYSYLQSFLAFQQKKGEMDRINIPYLRNRSGDLTLWYLLPMLLQRNYQFAGEPVVVTQDKALHRLIFRLLPPTLHSSRAVNFSVDPGEVDIALLNSIAEVLSGIEVSANQTLPERTRRMKLQFDLAAKLCTYSEESQALMDAWETWYRPGADLAMQLG